MNIRITGKPIRPSIFYCFRDELTSHQANSKSTSNTGPKGVIKDWQRFKQLETEKREEQENERQKLIQKLSLTCRPECEDDSELDELMSNDILIEFAQKRMEELMKKTAPDKKFGSLIHLKTGDQYLHAIDQESTSVTIIVHIFEEYVKSCRIMNDCLKFLSNMHPCVKFCKMQASTGGLSHQFKSEAIPALLVYKAGELIGNFIQLEEEFGTEFNDNDVANFLLEKGIVLDYSTS